MPPRHTVWRSLVGCFCYALAVYVSAAAEGPVRVAVVSQETSRDLLPVKLALVELSSRGTIALLERDRLDAVLKERQLGMAALSAGRGLAAIADLGVELLAVVIPTVVSPETAGSVIAFDCRHGWRCLDRVVPDDTPEAQSKAIVQAIDDALRIQGRHVPSYGLILSHSRNVNLTFSAFADLEEPLRLLLTRRLVGTGAVRVLERTHLGQIAMDQLLGAHGDALPSSDGTARLILERRGAPLKPWISLTLETLDHDPTVIMRLPVENGDIGGAADQLAEALLHHLGSTPVNSRADAALESSLLLDEATYLARAGLHGEALATAQGAFALNPTARLDDLVRQYRWRLCADMAHTQRNDRDALTYIAESLPPMLDRIRGQLRSVSGLGSHSAEDGTAERWAPIIPVVEVARLMSPRQGTEWVTFADDKAASGIRAELRTFALDVLRYRLQLARRASDRPTVFIDPFLARHCRRPPGLALGNVLRWCSDRPDSYPALLFDLGRQWLAQPAFAKAAETQPVEEQIAALESLINPLPSSDLDRQVSEPPLSAAERAHWREHIHFLMAHPDPLVAVYGQLAEFREKLARQALTSADAQARFRDLQRRLLRIAECAEHPKTANRARAACLSWLHHTMPSTKPAFRQARYHEFFEVLVNGSFEPDWNVVKQAILDMQPEGPEDGHTVLRMLSDAQVCHRRFHGEKTEWPEAKRLEAMIRRIANLTSDEPTDASATTSAREPVGGDLPWDEAACLFRIQSSRKLRTHPCRKIVVNDRLGFAMVYEDEVGSETSPHGPSHVRFMRFHHDRDRAEDLFRYRLAPDLRVTVATQPSAVLTDEGTLCVGFGDLIVLPPAGRKVRVIGEADGLPAARCQPLAVVGTSVLLKVDSWKREGTSRGHVYVLRYDLAEDSLKTLVSPAQSRTIVPADVTRLLDRPGRWSSDAERGSFVFTALPPTVRCVYSIANETWHTERLRPTRGMRPPRAEPPLYARPCIVGPWHWHGRPFRRVHRQTQTEQHFPDVIAGCPTGDLVTLFRHDTLVYAMGSHGMVRLHLREKEPAAGHGDDH